MSTICTFGWPIYSDVGVTYAPAVSGGSWSSTLPAANVQDRRLAKIARSNDALAASSTIVFDLGAARNVGLLAVFIPNLTKSSTPTIRWKANTSNSFGSPAYDSTAVQAWPTGLTAEDSAGLNVWSPVIPASIQNYEWWQLVITDTGNADGHVDVARVMICGAYTPTYNFSIGAKTGLETQSKRTLTDGGAAVYQHLPRARSDVFSIANLPNSEAYGTVRKMQRQLGITKQLFWVPDPSDTTLMYERAYCAVMRELGPLEAPNVLPANTISFALDEDL